MAAPVCFTACSLLSLFAPPQLQLPVGVFTPQRNCVLLLLLSQGISNANSTSLGKSCLTVTGSLFSRFVKLRATAKTQPSCQTSLKGRGKKKIRFLLFTLDLLLHPAMSLLDSFYTGCGEGSLPDCTAAFDLRFVLVLLRFSVQSGRFFPLRSSYVFLLSNSHLTILSACL